MLNLRKFFEVVVEINLISNGYTQSHYQVCILTLTR